MYARLHARVGSESGNVEPESRDQVTGLLTGVKIIDLTANMSGPFATMILAEQGADVVKVEPPGGEIIRRIGTGRGGMSVYFENLNHGKRSIVVDLNAPAGRDVIRRLASTADVVIQNFRPGVIERMGLGPTDLSSSNPQLIYLSISGYGRVGPLADTPAYDHVVQAMSGIAALQEITKEGAPSLVRQGLVDKTTGMAAAQAVTAALLRRCISGAGGSLEISMLDVALHFLWPDGMMNNTCASPTDVQPPISRGFRLTETADGHVSIITVTDRQWSGLLDALCISDPLEGGPESRLRSGGLVMREVGNRLRAMTTDEVTSLLRDHEVPCMPVVPLNEVAVQEQVRAAETLIQRDHPVLGPIVGPRSPVRIIDQEPVVPSAAPLPGAHTEEVLRESGFSSEEIASLRAEALIN